MSGRLFVEVSFKGSKVKDLWVEGVDIIQREYAHDIAIITLENEDVTVDAYKTRSPVTIKWGWAPSRLSTFIGYVNHSEPHKSSSGDRRLQVVCIGASYDLKNTRQKAWSGTPESIAAQILNDHKINPRLVKYKAGRVFKGLPQNGKSDFEFIAWVAKKVGFTFFFKNTEAHFYPRMTLFDKNKRNAPLFERALDNPGERRNFIFDFKPVVGESAGTGSTKAVRVAYGVDEKTGKLIGGFNNGKTNGMNKNAFRPQWVKYDTKEHVQSITRALEKMEAATEINRFHMQAKACVDGDPRITQASPVIFRGTGKATDGFWFVHEVEHVIRPAEYKCYLTVGRDSEGDTSKGFGSIGGTGYSINYPGGITGDDGPEAPRGLIYDNTLNDIDGTFEPEVPAPRIINYDDYGDLRAEANTAFGEEKNVSDYEDPQALLLPNISNKWESSYRSTPFSDLIDKDSSNINPNFFAVSEDYGIPR